MVRSSCCHALGTVAVLLMLVLPASAQWSAGAAPVYQRHAFERPPYAPGASGYGGQGQWSGQPSQSWGGQQPYGHGHKQHGQGQQKYRHGQPSRYMAPRAEGATASGWFQRPYPYHLDYYRMRYGGSYAPYFGNLYGPSTVYVAPPYYGSYYGNYGGYGYDYGYGANPYPYGYGPTEPQPAPPAQSAPSSATPAE